MPRPGPRRPQVAIRIGQKGLDHIDELAEAEGVNRSEMIRVLIREALDARHRRTRRSSSPRGNAS